MPIARAIAVIAALLGLASCAPASKYGDIYGRGSPPVHGGRINNSSSSGDFSETRDPDRRIDAASERTPHFGAVAAARRQALRDIGLQRQLDRARRVERRYDRAERALDWSAREHRRAVWRDRRPVRTGPYDRADFERRQAQFNERRARSAAQRAARVTDRARARLDRLDRADRIADRIDRIERMQRRQGG